MMQEDIRVQKIWQKSDRDLAILWTDGKESEFDVVKLRRLCPCAVCIDEFTHERKLRPEDVSEGVRPVRVESVGRYALNIKFNDGHGTGIYTFQMLRELH